MRNLEQIRAANAYQATESKERREGREGGTGVAKKVPSYIRNNGLLGAAAYAREVGAGYKDVLQDLINHLQHEEIALIQSSDLDGFIKEVGNSDSTKLRRVTDEAMAFFNYLRRFAD